MRDSLAFIAFASAAALGRMVEATPAPAAHDRWHHQRARTQNNKPKFRRGRRAARQRMAKASRRRNRR